MRGPIDLKATALALSRASRRAPRSLRTAIEWPASLGEGAWFFAPELISLQGTPAFEALDEAARRRLALREAINFFSLNVHGERSLMEGLSRRLYTRAHLETSEYLHHFLDEENKHMAYFGEFCLRYAGKLYPDRHLVLPRDYARGEEDFLFFAKILVFEEVVDHYNLLMARDLRLHPLARRINLLHHLDESRHLVFGRRMVKDLWDRWSPRWSAETRASVRDYLCGYLQATWAEYFNPDVYRDAGLADPLAAREAALASPAAADRYARATARCRRYLAEADILPEAS